MDNWKLDAMTEDKYKLISPDILSVVWNIKMQKSILNWLLFLLNMLEKGKTELALL